MPPPPHQAVQFMPPLLQHVVATADPAFNLPRNSVCLSLADAARSLATRQARGQGAGLRGQVRGQGSGGRVGGSGIRDQGAGYEAQG